MLFDSQIVTRGSGSIGGLTASHNRGGNYFRGRVTPVDPSSPAQNLTRAAMADLVNRFANDLTQAQRDAWAVYATNVELPGPLGNMRNVGAIGMYVRTNVSRSLIGALTRVDDAPVIFDLGGFTPIAIGVNAAADTLDIAYEDTDAWVNEDEAAMIAFASPPQNPGINYFTGPYRLAAAILGSVGAPPASPQSVALPFPVTAGQRLFAYVRVTRADGRYSNLQRVTAIAA